MANAGLSFVNYIDTAVISASEELETLPFELVRSPHLLEVWMSDPATLSTAWSWSADLITARPIKIIGVFNINSTPTATWRLKLSNVAAGSAEVLDSGVVAVAAKVVADERQQSTMYLPAAPSARFVHLDFSDPALGVGNPMTAGGWWVGDLWQPSFNLSFGVQQRLVDPSPVSYSHGGQAFVELRDKYRQADFSLDYLTETEAKGVIRTIDNRAGIGRNLLYVEQPGGTYQTEDTILGLFKELNPTAHARVNQFSRRFSVVERL